EQIVDTPAVRRVAILGALEHHVLEEVSRAGITDRLVPRADAIDDHGGDDRRAVVLHEQDLQTIGIEPELPHTASFADERDTELLEKFRIHAVFPTLVSYPRGSYLSEAWTLSRGS